MLTWFLFALAAPLVWSLGNALDSALRRTELKDDWVLMFGSVATRLVIGLILVSLFPIGEVNTYVVLGLILTGFCWSFGMLPYFRALESEEPSRVVIYMQMVPLWGLTFAAVILGEHLSLLQGLSFLFILTGGTLASIRPGVGKKWTITTAFWLIFAACILWGFADVMFKYFSFSVHDFWTAFGILTLGSGLPVLLFPLYKPARQRIRKGLSGLTLRGWIFLAIPNVGGIMGTMCLSKAITLGPVALSSVLMGIQPLAVLTFVALLKPFVPEVELEKMDAKSLLLKFVSIAWIILGLVFINLSSWS